MSNNTPNITLPVEPVQSSALMGVNLQSLNKNYIVGFHYCTSTFQMYFIVSSLDFRGTMTSTTLLSDAAHLISPRLSVVEETLKKD